MMKKHIIFIEYLLYTISLTIHRLKYIKYDRN